MGRILLVSLIPTAILLYLKQVIEINLISIILLGTLFFLVYFVLIFITKSLDKNDLMILDLVKKKFNIGK